MTKFDLFLKNFLKESPVPAPNATATPANTNLDFSKLTPQQQTAVKTALTTNKPLVEVDPQHPLLAQLVQKNPQQQAATPAAQAKPGMAPVANKQNPTTPTNAANQPTV